jgi:hypothetical protein
MVTKILIWGLLLITNSCWAVDTYDGKYLKIAKVLAGDLIYSNVVITIDSVVAVKGGVSNRIYDTYSPATNQLEIPSVNYGNVNYTNVIVTVGSIISIQGATPLSDLYYEEVADGFPDLSRYAKILNNKFMITNIAVLDFNNDGKNDILVHMWRRWDPALDKDVNKPTPNLLIALVQNKDGRFEDQTLKIFGTDFVDLAGAASRKVRVADINNDGFLDVIFATNKEDGRPMVEDNWKALSAAVMSSGDGTYKVQTFGKEAYHHSVEIIDDLGKGKVILLEDNPPNAYFYKSNKFQEVDGLPTTGGGTFLGYKNKDSKETDKIITQLGYPESSIFLYKKNINGQWDKAAVWKFEKARSIQVGNSNNDLGSYYAYTYKGREYLDGGFGTLYESCALKISPTDSSIPLFKWSPQMLPINSQNRTTFMWSEIDREGIFNKILQFNESSGSLVERDFIIDDVNSENVFFLGCMDFNNDGFDDLSQHPFRNGARPILHLNNKAGKLIKVNEASFPFDPRGEVWTSMFIDLNKNGSSDLIYFAANGCWGNYLNCNTFKLWKNIRRLEF